MEAQALMAAILAGAMIGFILALVGGGGSILAVPLLVYLVGVESTHMAIGTAAVAVAINAAIGLGVHARGGEVKWSCAGVFALFAVAGAALGAELGKAMDGQALLVLFAIMMIVVGLLTTRKRSGGSDPNVRLARSNAGILLPKLIPAGFGVGSFSGFFGIGGGFLIVPGLIAATRMPIAAAISSSLLVVATIGSTTALSYAASGYVDWRLVGLMGVGGIFGAVLGLGATRFMGRKPRILEVGFGLMVVAVGCFVLVREVAL